jgi:small subunit ribosomal protein S1
MSEEATIDTTSDSLHNTVVAGTYVERDDEGYVFELEGGDRAVVDPGEFEDEAPWEPGDEMSVLVEQRRNGRWTASVRKVGKLELWEEIEAAAESERVIEGDIIKENKGGLSVDVGVRAFLPRSHVELHRVDDCSKYVGRRESFTILKFDQQRCNIVLSRRKVLEQEREEKRRELVESIEEGETFEGVVRNLQPYGAFVDIGGIDGLLHISNISWERIDHPSEVLQEGDDIEVVVLEFDPDEEELSLGRKQLLDNPWDRFEEDHAEGDVVTGEVVNLADFGAFVEIATGIEGLVHVTEISWVDQTTHPNQVLDPGDTVEVEILEIDSDEERVSLSIKRTEPNPWEEFAETVEVGDVVTGEVQNITDFGMFVEVADDVEGLVHVSDISWTEQIDDVSDHYESGEEIEAKVLEVDVEAQRLGLGLKQLTDDPWSQAEEIAEPGEKIEVEITKLTDFGAFAEVVEGVEGLIHISELADRRIDHPREVVRPGKKLEALVLSFDRGEERISLSLKRDQLEEEQDEYVEDEEPEAKLGDVIGEQLKAGMDGDE